jgi:type IV secretory pathway TraG/TraD family ATPase VirD4
VFIGSRPPEREALKPLVSAWLDTASAKLLLKTGEPPTWVFLDELPTLQRLPKLKSALQEAGKYNVRFVLGFQGRAQLEHLYGREAETLMSAPATRLFLQTKEWGAAKWCAENIGMPEQERGTDSLTSSADGGRDSMNTATERRVDYLVLPNEIQNLSERTGYLRYGPYAVPVSFGYTEFPERNVFREREGRADRRAAEGPDLRILQGGLKRRRLSLGFPTH